MNIKNYKKNKKSSKSTTGFAMLFAVLTASLLLSIGLAIFNISFKELLISTNARESQIAFYAADSARECAVYWTIKKGAFQACFDNNCAGGLDKFVPGEVELANVVCNGGATPLELTDGATSTYSLDKFIKIGTTDLDPDSSIEIIRSTNPAKDIITTITANGHNTGVSGRRLERSIEQTIMR
jgi:Tfp pilus assembly protein PilX